MHRDGYIQVFPDHDTGIIYYYVEISSVLQLYVMISLPLVHSLRGLALMFHLPSDPRSVGSSGIFKTSSLS